MAKTDIEGIIDLLNKDIPIAPDKEIGFLDIVDQTYKETTICKVYKHFLDQESSPSISNSMMDELLNLIKQKYIEKGVEKELLFDSYNVFLEVVTSNGRIDIVIEDVSKTAVVIIEVKVYHNLEGNDLKDYWEHYSNYSDKNKAAVVLPLERMDISGKLQHEDYIVITHNEWLKRVAESIGQITKSKGHLYFNDFVANMDYLTKSIDMNEQTRFYLENAEKINQAIETRDSAIEYSLSQLQMACEELSFEIHGRSEVYKCLLNEDSNEVYYTIFVEEIMNPNIPVKVVLELFGTARTYSDRIIENLKSSTFKDDLQFEDNYDSSFIHLLSRSKILEPKNYANLKNTIKELIEDLEPIRKYIIEDLKGIRKL